MVAGEAECRAAQEAEQARRDREGLLEIRVKQLEQEERVRLEENRHEAGRRERELREAR